MKTKYRIVSDGWKYFLEYEKEKTICWLFTYKVWTKVWKPYYEAYSLLNHDSYFCAVSSYKKIDLMLFANQWPDVEEYLVGARDEQDQLIKQAFDKMSENLRQSKEVQYL